MRTRSSGRCAPRQGSTRPDMTAIEHSLGVTIAIRLAARHDWLAGIVLLYASCRSA